MMRAPRALRSLALPFALLLAACGGGEAARGPATVATPAPTPAATPRAEATPARPEPLICLDPGHSKHVPKITVDVDGEELREADINLDVALAMAGILRERFGDDAVVLTWGEEDGRERPWDALTGPEEDSDHMVRVRGAWCSGRGARVIASVHTNAFDGPLNGTMTLYRDDDSRLFAESVHRRMLDALRYTPDGAEVEDWVDFGPVQDDWLIARSAWPGTVVVILEPVLMTEPAEARRLLPPIAAAPDGRRAQIAEVQAAAIAEYVETAVLSRAERDEQGG